MAGPLPCRRAGWAGLGRAARADRGRSRFPEPLRLLVEGLALRTPVPSAAHVHRQVTAVAEREGWPVPSYSSVYAIIRGIDPALRTLAVEGDKRYAEVFELVYRRQAGRSNEIWQAYHTQLDLWVITPAGQPTRPWLTVIEDDYSRAITGYAVNLGAPSALQTALVLRQAIWRKAEPGWRVCGIPAVFYTDHGSDFTSRHMEQAASDLGMRLVFSLPGQPRGRGKVERYMDTINQMCLSALPGYAPRGTKDRAGQARLSLAELDAALGEFIVTVYNNRVHSETGQPPQARWEAGGFLPRLPESPEQLDLLLLTVAKPRKVHPDGIRFQGLRYLDPVLALTSANQRSSATTPATSPRSASSTMTGSSAGCPVPVVPSCLLEPAWVEFRALLDERRGGEPPEFAPGHPGGCHRRRIPDRVVFEHVIGSLVPGQGMSGSPRRAAQTAPSGGGCGSGRPGGSASCCTPPRCAHTTR